MSETIDLWIDDLKRKFCQYLDDEAERLRENRRWKETVAHDPGPYLRTDGVPGLIPGKCAFCGSERINARVSDSPLTARFVCGTVHSVDGWQRSPQCQIDVLRHNLNEALDRETRAACEIDSLRAAICDARAWAEKGIEDIERAACIPMLQLASVVQTARAWFASILASLPDTSQGHGNCNSPQLPETDDEKTHA